MKNLLISGVAAVLSFSVSAPRATADSSGMMYHNAVANQQKTNVIGMSSTATLAHTQFRPSTREVIEHALRSQGDAVASLWYLHNPVNEDEWTHAHSKELDDALHQASRTLDILRAFEKELPPPQH